MPTDLPPRRPCGYGENRPFYSRETLLWQIAVLALIVSGLLVSIKIDVLQAPSEFSAMLLSP
jgi:hypothetical protein